MAEDFIITVGKSFYFDNQQGNFFTGGDIQDLGMRFTFYNAPLINVHDGDLLYEELGHDSNGVPMNLWIRADMNGQIQDNGILSVRVYVQYMIPRYTSVSWNVMLYGSLPFTFTAYAP